MIASLIRVDRCCGPASGLFLANTPLALVAALSIVIGLLIVLVFRYTSNQKELHRAKDQLKAHLLAVRLFQDQLPVVLRSYGRILRGTGRYLRLAFTPLLFVIVPITLLVVHLDRYLGSMPLQPGQQFLVKIQAARSDVLNGISLQVPPGMAISAPPVHIPGENEVVWRVVASRDGAYTINAAADGQTVSKQVAVARDVRRLSPARWRNHFWRRWFVSGEPAIPDASAIDCIEVQYPPRNIGLAGVEFNWIVLFFVFSIAAGFIFKSVLRIEI